MDADELESGLQSIQPLIDVVKSYVPVMDMLFNPHNRRLVSILQREFKTRFNVFDQLFVFSGEVEFKQRNRNSIATTNDTIALSCNQLSMDADATFEYDDLLRIDMPDEVQDLCEPPEAGFRSINFSGSEVAWDGRIYCTECHPMDGGAWLCFRKLEWIGDSTMAQRATVYCIDERRYRVFRRS